MHVYDVIFIDKSILSFAIKALHLGMNQNTLVCENNIIFNKKRGFSLIKLKYFTTNASKFQGFVFCWYSD